MTNKNVGRKKIIYKIFKAIMLTTLKRRHTLNTLARLSRGVINNQYFDNYILDILK